MPPKEDKERPGVADELFFMAILEQVNAAIDWDKVANRCNIVSKGAAAKRWSRLKTKYETEHIFKFAGFTGKKGEAKPATETGEGEDGTESPKKTPTKKLPATQLPAKKPPTKKRKVDDTVKDEGEEAREQEVGKKEDEEVGE